MISDDIGRLEAERLRSLPPAHTRADTIRETLDQLIGVLYDAIREDQRAGKWSTR